MRMPDFTHRFGRAAEYSASAPGRATLIGGQTPANGGYVRPVVLSLLTRVDTGYRASTCW